MTHPTLKASGSMFVPRGYHIPEADHRSSRLSRLRGRSVDIKMIDCKPATHFEPRPVIERFFVSPWAEFYISNPLRLTTQSPGFVKRRQRSGVPNISHRFQKFDLPRNLMTICLRLSPGELRPQIGLLCELFLRRLRDATVA